MSGFYVLGVPKQKLDEIVTRRIAAMERRLKCPPNRARRNAAGKRFSPRSTRSHRGRSFRPNTACRNSAITLSIWRPSTICSISPWPERTAAGGN